MNSCLTQEDNFYEIIIERYSDMILRIAFQNTLNRCDAEDIVQEVFIRFFSECSFTDEAHMKAWLIRVTINLARDLKKSFWHRNVGALVEEWTPFTDTQNEVLEEIERLPVKYRNVIYLYYFEGYSIREIAEILETKENTVSSWIGRARKKLKSLILDGGDEHESK